VDCLTANILFALGFFLAISGNTVVTLATFRALCITLLYTCRLYGELGTVAEKCVARRKKQSLGEPEGNHEGIKTRRGIGLLTDELTFLVVCARPLL
jgi:hypothetical protein